MNEHIELVKKWLEDKDSVSLEELEANREAADAAYANNKDDGARYAAYAAYYAYVDYDTAAYAATYWVKRYEDTQV